MENLRPFLYSLVPTQELLPTLKNLPYSDPKTLILEFQVCKERVLWGLKYIGFTVGLLGDTTSNNPTSCQPAPNFATVFAVYPDEGLYDTKHCNSPMYLYYLPDGLYFTDCEVSCRGSGGGGLLGAEAVTSRNLSCASLQVASCP